MNNKNITFYILSLVLLLAATACSNSDSGNMSASKKAHSLGVNRNNADVEGEENSSDTIEIEAENTRWEVVNTTDWITVSPSTGKGNQRIIIKVKENPSWKDSREDIIEIRSAEQDYQASIPVRVYQWAAKTYVIPEKTEILCEAVNGIASIEVKSNVNWEPRCSQSWVTVKKDGNNLNIKVEDNPSTKRSAEINIDGETWGYHWMASIKIEQKPNPIVCKEFVVSRYGRTASFDMVFVEGGTFSVGDNSIDSGPNGEGPIKKSKHDVTLTSFYIADTEVTQALWLAVMGEYNSRWSQAKLNNLTATENDKKPIYWVSRLDCDVFIEKLNTLLSSQLPDGMIFRLPTEAQWEFAARGGIKSKNFTYSGSNDANKVGVFYYERISGPWSVASKEPNELGIHDMSGNVEEWCYDKYGSYPTSTVIDPSGPTVFDSYWDGHYVVRGGCWGSNADGLKNPAKPSMRNHEKGDLEITYHYYIGKYLGFRLLLK